MYKIIYIDKNSLSCYSLGSLKINWRKAMSYCSCGLGISEDKKNIIQDVIIEQTQDVEENIEDGLNEEKAE